LTPQERAIARACLDQVLIGMTELREIRNWWVALTDNQRDEYKVFTASVMKYHSDLRD